MAEEAAWTYQKKMEIDGKHAPEICTINPSWVQGECIVAGFQTSSTITKQIMNGEIPGYPTLPITCVDVKDVSLAHYRALVRPEAKNQRFILSQETGTTFRGLAETLYTVLRENGYNYEFSRREIPRWMLWIGAVFSRDLESIYPHSGKPAWTFDNSKSRNVLGIEYKRSLRELLLETAESLIRIGAIPLKRA